MVERFERDYLTRCLREARGNISQAAKATDMDYKNLYTKMQQLRIDPPGVQGLAAQWKVQISGWLAFCTISGRDALT